MKKYHILIYLFFTLGIGKSSAQYTILHNFGSYPNDGENPYGSLTLVGKVLYGMTRYGGAHFYGSIFAIDTSGSGYRDLHDFDSIHGSGPLYDSLVYSSGILYGMTAYGGADNLGCIFSIDTNGNNYKDLLDFNGTKGANPNGGLTLLGGQIYGMTSKGGTGRRGCIFSIDTNGIVYSDLHDFNGTDGESPLGSLTLSGKVMYGMTYSGGLHSLGIIFSMDTGGGNFKDLFDFNNNRANNPYGDLTLFGKVLYGMTYTTGSAGCIFSIDTDGSGYKILLNFNDTNGASPIGSLVLSSQTLYGMSAGGASGPNAHGVIFSIDTDGNNYNDLFDFNGTNGYNPQGSLTLSGKVLYGMTTYGGISGLGVIFKIDTSAVAGINEVKTENGEVKVYPNPALNSITVQMQLLEKKNVEFVLYNTIGEMVYDKKLTEQAGTVNHEINISLLSNGIYLLKVDEGNKYYTKKIIKQE